MTGRLEGKTGLISGGSRGLGASHAERFVAEGASVVVGDILDDLGKELVDRLGPSARYVHLDVREKQDWAAAVALAEAEFGTVTTLVNNAGLGGEYAQIPDLTLENWHYVLGVNLDGSLLGIQAAVPSMRRGGVGGSIINTSSFAGLSATPMSGAYTTAKFALRGLTKVAAVELGREGIRVNSIHPGYIKTPALASLDEERVGAEAKLALPRMAEPFEVSNLVLYLASDESSYSTGAEFVVDGGWSAGAPISIASSVPGVRPPG